MTDRQAVLTVRHATKEFSGVRVLDNISFNLKPGGVLGIIGENGAGKSTLLKIISGVYKPTAGEVIIDGVKLTQHEPMAARKLGVTMIPQEFNLVNDLTVFENVFLGQEHLNGPLLNKNKMAQESAALLRRLNSNISPLARIDTLSAAQKQMVEIAKALAGGQAKVMIMDEPTTVLNRSEVDTLFTTIRDLKARGVAIIYISHKLREVKEICDHVLVMRDGQFITYRPTSEMTEVEMATSMVGRELTQVFPPKVKPQDEIALEVENLTVDRLLHNISFSVRKGEVFGLAGLMGSGRTETAEALMGLLKKKAGRVTILGREVKINSPSEAMAAGLNYLSEDRQGKGILVKCDIMENTCLSSLPKYCRRGLISNRKRGEKAAEYVKEFSIRAASLKANLEFFSGGNQQKVALAKCLDTNPGVIIFDEPTRGIDIKAKSDIYSFIQSASKRGLATIFISSEQEEIIGLCHRVAVLHEGFITGILEGDQINEEEIMLHATGLKGHSRKAH